MPCPFRAWKQKVITSATLTKHRPKEDRTAKKMKRSIGFGQVSSWEIGQGQLLCDTHGYWYHRKVLMLSPLGLKTCWLPVEFVSFLLFFVSFFFTGDSNKPNGWLLRDRPSKLGCCRFSRKIIITFCWLKGNMRGIQKAKV